MKLALFTDLHANRQALEAVWAHARSLGFDRAAFLGDYVDYGADPVWVIDFVMARVQEGALAVKGNHDQAMAEGPNEHMGADVATSVHWTLPLLESRHRDFLASLPYTVRDGECLLTHANAHQPERWGYMHGNDDARRSLRATTARMVFCGHVHEPALFHMNALEKVAEFTPVAGVPIVLSRQRRWLALPGSVGQPRDGNPAAAWALLDAGRDTLTFHRVPYDHEEAARRIRAAGLPESHAERLSHGR